MAVKAETKKVILSASLASVLLVAVFINDQITNVTHTGAQSRGVASVGSLREQMRDSAWEADIAKRLANEPKRSTASVAQNPTQFDELAFGFLEGKYAIRRQNGKIAQIEFIDQKEEGDRPKYITNRIEFLKAKQELFPYDFNEVKEVEAKGGNETYALLNDKQQEIGRVQFKLDEYGRFISLVVL